MGRRHVSSSWVFDRSTPRVKTPEACRVNSKPWASLQPRRDEVSYSTQGPASAESRLLAVGARWPPCL
ncbi:hypothetical protein CapIbe_021126 [Capra ibex]